MLVSLVLLASVGVTGLVAACSNSVAGTGTGAGPGPASSSAGPATSSPSAGKSDSRKPISARTVSAPGGGATYLIEIWAKKHVTNCAAHAYGPVVRFLRAHPCAGLDQLLATTRVHGRPVAFAERTIAFRGSGYRAAGAFRAMVSRNGTGNLNDLLREGYRLPSGPKSVPFPNAFSALAQDNGVTVIEAWYLDGPTQSNDAALEQMCQDIFLQI